jgi:phage terminase large subunit-like protein
MTAPEGRPTLDWVAEASDDDLAGLLATLDETETRAAHGEWPLWARPGQLAPQGDWRCWLVMAGRGFGKTRAGAEWVRQVAENDPFARIALVGASLGEARAVMVEGESGLLAIAPARQRPHFEPSLRRLTWPNGAQALLYSAGEPESMRGPQHGYAWCDEIAKWDNAGGRALSAWDNLLLGLRLGRHPRVAATTTPRAVPLVRRLLKDAELAPGEVAVTTGRTEDNAANLPARFLRDMRRAFGGTTLGRQELDGELIADIPGALWTRALLETCRADREFAAVRVVVGVDPPASAEGDACGIVVAGIDADGNGRVLADASAERASPERWARAVAAAAESWGADRVVAEANQGGAMVASVLRAASLSLPLRLVHASRGKAARAEPIAALYEAGRVRHAGTFARLEDEMCGLIAGGGYQGPGRSPDRADALVWALTELMLGRTGEPRVAAI